MAFVSLETLINIASVSGMAIIWFFFKNSLEMYINILKLQTCLLKEATGLLNLRNGEAPPAYSPN